MIIKYDAKMSQLNIYENWLGNSQSNITKKQHGSLRNLNVLLLLPRMKIGTSNALQVSLLAHVMSTIFQIIADVAFRPAASLPTHLNVNENLNVFLCSGRPYC